MHMKRDQKGFTIVELLIAVAILSIVVASVCGFILVGSRSYAAANSDINVQQESQLALNQMSDLLIDTTRSVTYTGFDAVSGTPENALKDAEFSFTPKDKSLVMYNGVVEEDVDPISGAPTVKAAEGNGNKHYQFYWSKDDEKLYYTELAVDPVNHVKTADIHFPAFDPTNPNWVVLATHVTDFSADLSQLEEKRVVQLSLTFVDGAKEYVTSNNVTIRNKVGVNDAELEPVNKRKTIAVAARDFGVIIEPGETYHFSTPKVTGENVTDRSVKWSVETSGSSNTVFTDKANGILKVGRDEPAGDIKVKITTIAVGSDGQPATCKVIVHIKRVTDILMAKTSDTDPDNAPNEISPGCTFTISATATGYKLGEVCSVCGDDTSVDNWVVYSGMDGSGYPNRSNVHGRLLHWYIHNPSKDGDGSSDWDPTQYIDIIDQGPDHATFRVNLTGRDGNPTPTSIEGDSIHTYGVVIQAAAYLPERPNDPYGRDYDMVGGSISLVMVKGKNNLHLDGNFRWGAVSTIKVDPRPEDFNKAGQGHYLVFARIRKSGSSEKEKLMVFGTVGDNALITPDLFGVDEIKVPWDVSLQVLDPGASFGGGTKNLEKGEDVTRTVEGISDATVRKVVEDYLKNCDSSGTYIGSYAHTGKITETLNPPKIIYEGQADAGKLELAPVSALAGGVQMTPIKIKEVLNTRGDRDGVTAFINDYIRFCVTKLTDGGEPKSIYYYDDKTQQFKGELKIYNETIVFENFDKSVSTAQIKLENKPENFADAAGKYEIKPYITYQQNPKADTTYGVYYADYIPSYWKEECYPVPENMVYYTLESGGNLTLWSYDDNRFTKGEINFPAPDQISAGNPSASYFDYFFNVSDLKADLNWHDARRNHRFTKLVANGENKQYYYQSSKIQGRYVKEKDTYELRLYYTYFNNTWGPRHIQASAGEFWYDASTKKWVRTNKGKGTFDSDLEKDPTKNPDTSTARVNFTMNNTTYTGRTYIPLPSEDAFVNTLGFKREYGDWQKKFNFSLKYQPDGQEGQQDMHIDKMICFYDKLLDRYEIRIYEGTDTLRATYHCKSDGDKWELQYN